ncbi:hypothetical protein F5890DRAFT_1517579 [Lentinula detonsa]|uniref:Uncharacterized protein n=1 Tax=Lentinula detonsa TaxID=2804962 RepID=A0AA38Q072_9AGAR|nr:hypothetical protein F5890DRAFT_1517579 [Lentinula detonsa]
MSHPEKSSKPILPSIDTEIIKKYNITEVECNTLSEFEVKQDKFQQWLTAQKLDSVETTALSCRTFEDVATFWSDMSKNTESDFNILHQSGWKLWTKKYQNFSEGASSFMRDLKPIFDIVTGMGVPYAGLAIGIINGLITFAGKKNTMENQISSAIEGIKDRLPGLKMYQAIYTGNNELETDLQKKILFAYLAFVDLSMDIMKYFIQPGYRRWGTALFKSGSFTTMTSNIYSSLSDIRLRCEELIGLRIDTLVRGMDALKTQNQVLLARIDELQQDQTTAHVLEIQDVLDLASWTPEHHHKKLAEYKSRLLYEQHEELGIYQQMTGHEIEKLRGTDAFVDWARPSSSGVLILRGINNENLSESKIHNWLSPFALDIADWIHKRSPSPNAVYIFDSADHASRSIFKAIPMVLFQLLWFQRPKLGSKSKGHYEALMAALHQYASLPLSQGDGNLKVQALGSLATQVVHLYEGEKQPVYIILDRVDQCSDHYELMNILVNRMMRESTSFIKILLVAATNWPKLEYLGFGPLAPVHEVTLRQDFLDYNDY